MSYKLDAACFCSIGKVRKNNEDNFYFNGYCLKQDNHGLKEPIIMSKRLSTTCGVAIFDGMGGENFGEVASFAAADCMGRTKRRRKEFLIPDEQYYNDLCLRINQSVLDKQSELLTRRMGSTLVALFFSRDSVTVCNLGDSRAYRLRDGELRQVSVDHVEMRRGNDIRKPHLTQHLGIGPDDFIIEPYISKEELKRGDQYLLCSDGVTDMLGDEEISEIMKECSSAKESALKLVEAALERGGKDNTTVIICRIL